MAAGFIDARNPGDGAARRVRSFQYLIEHAADLFDDALVGFIPRIDRQDAFAGRVENHLAEWNGPQLVIFAQQPRNELIDLRFFRRLR